jgi:hypothetical protein
MVKLDEKDLYQLLIAEFRYSVKRDNHLAPDTCAQHIKDYLPEMSKQWRVHTAKQLTEEIIDERLWHSRYFKPGFKFSIDIVKNNEEKDQLEEDYIWEELLVFLVNYLEDLPYNIDKYMTYIKGCMTYSEGIDYFSTEVQDKLKANKEKI